MVTSTFLCSDDVVTRDMDEKAHAVGFGLIENRPALSRLCESCLSDIEGARLEPLLPRRRGAHPVNETIGGRALGRVLINSAW